LVKKTQTLTKKSKLLYEGIPKPVGSTVMSHGRLRSYAMIKALQGRAPLGQKLRLSDYKRNVKTKKGKITKASQKYELRNYKILKQKLYPYSRKLPKGNIEKKPKTRLEQLEKNFDTKWKMGNAEIRLRELLGQKYRN